MFLIQLLIEVIYNRYYLSKLINLKKKKKKSRNIIPCMNKN